jgi:Ran GTPase-activating protein (RanGAP) involved in mRNA processing and transport
MEVKVTVDYDYLLKASWSGAKDRVTKAMEDDKLDELLELCEMVFDGVDDVTDTDLNDFIWFNEEVDKLLYPDEYDEENDEEDEDEIDA